MVLVMYRLGLMILGIIGVLSTGIANTSPCSEHQCIAVIDAGSTGSRLHLFSYDTDGTGSPVDIKDIWSKKIKPGFATIEPDSKTVDTYLTTLFSGFPAQNIPVYFYATAGMRLIPSSKQKNYYHQVRQWFAQHTQWHLIEARTITGNEEASYDWLSVNYHLGTLQSSDKSLVGVMDMGGASVQIVFPIQSQDQSNPRSPMELDLYGRHIQLFTHSFLGLGQNEMSHQFLNSAACFSKNYPLPDGETGDGNAVACEQEVSSLLNKVHGVNQVVQPGLTANPVETWYVIGALSNLAENHILHFNNHQLTSASLLEQADTELCHQLWDTLYAQFPNDEYLFQYCLSSAYFYALMVEGYGLHPDQMINYIDPAISLDWTLGVVLRSASH